MARVIGTEIPDNKRLIIALTYIYGVGGPTAAQIVQKLNFDPDKRVRNMTQDEIALLNKLLQTEEYLVEGDKRREVQNNIKRLINIHSYRGMRHRLGLPVRGQRTQTNARTRKGKKRTVAGRKK